MRLEGRPTGRSEALALTALGLAAAAGAASPPAREVRLVMGTTAEVRATLPAENAGAALDAAFAALDLVDRRMSLWKESELRALNRSGAALVSPETAAVLAHALEVAEASGGAFDPTVEPLLRARGDYGGAPRDVAPGEERRLLAAVGWRRVHLDRGTRRVRLERGTRLDLGGIAKGYATDLALAALRDAGAQAGLVDLGGSSLGSFGETLEVVLRDPEDPGRPPFGLFRAREASVSTSAGDQKPGHIVDPRTGSAASAVLTATVVARSGIEADALSTAVFVLGPEDGLALVARRGAAGLALVREEGRAVVRTTPGFAAGYALELAPRVEARP